MRKVLEGDLGRDIGAEDFAIIVSVGVERGAAVDRIGDSYRFIKIEADDDKPISYVLTVINILGYSLSWV